jgi:hypothetical protein
MYESPKIEELGTLEEMTSNSQNKPGVSADGHSGQIGNCGHGGCNGS